MEIMKNTLVAGGAGFIGFHLCKRLLHMGCHVICLDNLYTGTKKHVDLLARDSNFEWVEHDVVIPFQRDNIDEIYNLACPASPIHYQRAPIQTTKTAVIGALNLLDLARRNSCKYLQASTSEVYGDPDVHPQSEGYKGCVNPLGIRSCYDEGKRCAESLCMDFYRQHHFPVKIIRIFNTYGPHMQPNDGRVISNFIMQALQNENITIYGRGDQTRSFQYIDDLIDGVLLMMDTEDDFTGPVNIGNPGEYTILDLAERIIKMTGSKSRIVHKPFPADDPVRRRPDIMLAKRMLRWSPQIDLEQGLKKTIDYFRGLI